MTFFKWLKNKLKNEDGFIGAAIIGGAIFGGVVGVGAIVATTLGAIAVGALAGAVVGYALETVAELFIPDITFDSSTYKGRNPVYTVEEGKPIARCYGRCRIAGNIVRSNDPGETTIKAIIGHGQGEIDGLLSWKINNIEWDHLTSVAWWATNYAGSIHWKNTLNGTDSQSPIQVNSTNLFTLNACAYRGIAHTGFNFTKNTQIGSLGSILVEGRFTKCEPIGGGAEVFSRNPAVVMWDFYRNVEGYAIADLDENAFNSLKALCDAYPSSGDGGPIRPPGPNNTTVQATTTSTSINLHAPFFAFDANLAIDGSVNCTQWFSLWGRNVEQRLNVDLGISVVLTKIVLVNGHISGGQTTRSAKDFVIQGSNTAGDLDHTAYADAGSGWTDVQTGLTATQYDSADPYKTYEVASPGTAYRYYSIKIANGHGGSDVSIRDCCFWGRSPRYTFDFNFDSKININDAKKLIWSSFNGRVIRSQGKLKPVWDWSTMADGAGGLTAKTSSYSFTMDNIVKGSFTWFPTKRANKFTVQYLDSSEGYKKSSVSDKDDSDIDDRGEILLDKVAYYITQRDVVARRCKRKKYRSQYNDYRCKFAGWPSSQKLEAYDLVQVTHTLPGWTSKEFIVLDKIEDEHGRPVFLLEAYYSGVFDDSETPLQQSYLSTLPAPFDAPAHVTSPVLTDTSYWGATGHYILQAFLTYTTPLQSVFWEYAKIQYSTARTQLDEAEFDEAEFDYLVGAGNFADYPILDKSEGTGFVIDGLTAGMRVGENLTVRPVSINVHGVEAQAKYAPTAYIEISEPSLYDAISKILPNGGEIVLPQGTYTLPSGGLILPDRDISIRGVNRDAVILKNVAGSDGLVLHNLTKQFKFSDFTIESQNVASYSYMIYVYGDTAAENTSDVTVNNINLTLVDNGNMNWLDSEGDSGIKYYQGIGEITVLGCKITNGYSGVSIYGDVKNCYLKELKIKDCLYNSILITFAKNIYCLNNHIQDFKFYGLRFAGFTSIKECHVIGNIVQSKNHATDKTTYGIVVEAISATIAENRVTIENGMNSGSQYGINARVKSAIITNNQVNIDVDSNSTLMGIHLRDIENSLIDANNITIDGSDNTSDHYGIYTNALIKNTLTNNKINMVTSNTKDTGIYLNATSNNNQISSNDIQNFGTRVKNEGSGNIVSLNTESGVNIAQADGQFTRQYLR